MRGPQFILVFYFGESPGTESRGGEKSQLCAEQKVVRHSGVTQALTQAQNRAGQAVWRETLAKWAACKGRLVSGVHKAELWGVVGISSGLGSDYC